MAKQLAVEVLNAKHLAAFQNQEGGREAPSLVRRHPRQMADLLIVIFFLIRCSSAL